MSWLVLKAWLELIKAEYFLRRGNFNCLYGRVKTFPIDANPSAAKDRERVCRAVELACAFYFKEVLCLQRSAVTSCLLRRYGIPAQMVIGVQHMPFRSHAWVEADGEVINDAPHVRDLYMVLDRC
jgi:hypothetical protein